MSTSSSSTGGQQFRYTQTPSKVLHLRNLPWECAPEELAELCKPFGPIVDTKCNVGANRNQAFVEFAELNQAISMVSYYATSSEPAQIRGKTVYIQYSNRQEIVHSKTVGESVGNVLLVTIEGVEAGDVSIDVLHLVFSAFGFVQKLATFEKTMGFQALVQYPDTDTATAARDALDGRSIPRYLLPEHVNTCYLRISYSAHTDLNIKFQSHRSRDYTNPYLPVNPTAIDGTTQQVTGPDGKKMELESNVLHANFENAQYPITVDVLHTVFSAFGTVQKIAIFEKNGGTQALIQYPDIATAKVAKGALEGHSIYDGGYCKIHLTYSRHTDLVVKAYSDKSRDYTVPIGGVGIMPRPPVPMQAAPNSWQNAGPTAPMYNGQMPPYPPGAVNFAGQAFPQPGAAYQPPANPHQASQPGAAYQPPANPHQASQPGLPFQAPPNNLQMSQPGQQFQPPPNAHQVSLPGPPFQGPTNPHQASQPMPPNGGQARPPHYYQ